MSWTPLYINVEKTECVGTSLSTFNHNFDEIDTYLRDLSAEYMPIDTNFEEISLAGSGAQTNARNNLGLGTVATLPASVGARAWINFDGRLSSLTQMNGTFSRSSNTLTVNINSHGLIIGDYVSVIYNSGSSSKIVQVLTSSTNQFTALDINPFTAVSGGTGTIGTTNCYILEAPIIAQYNMRKVMRLLGYGGKITFVAHFTNSLPSANFCAVATGTSGNSGSNEDDQTVGIANYATNAVLVSINNSSESSSRLNIVCYA